MAIQIDKGIPVPQSRKAKPKSEELETILSLEIGDSFFIEVPRNCLTSKASYASRLTKRTYSIRAREENGVQGLRVWRLE